MQMLEQQRAQHAWEKCEGLIEDLNSSSENTKFSEYTNVAKGLPPLVMNSGLMQTMAFLEQKNDGSMHKRIASDMREWLHKQFGQQAPREFKDFMEAMLKVESLKYQEITTEAMAWLKWLRQLAAALDKDN